MGKLIDRMFPCCNFSSEVSPTTPLGESIVPSQQLGCDVPYRNIMAGSMYYQGGPANSKKPQSNSGTNLEMEEVARKPGRGKMRSHKASVDKVMAWNDGTVGPPGSILDTERLHPAFRTNHVRFGTNIPSRSSTRTGASQVSPARASAFKVSSPGDVSPFSLHSSPRTASSLVEASARNPRADHGDSSMEAAPRTPSFIAPVPQQLTKLPAKPGRPTLALKIPDLLVEPLKESAPSDSSSEANSQVSAKTTPIATPAHAKRFPTQAGTRAAKTPKRVNLSDELGAVGEILSGSAEQVPSPRPVEVEWNTSVHDWALQKHRYTSPKTDSKICDVISEPPDGGEGVAESPELVGAVIEG
ncbi:MAG: hypothetical protein LQ352_006430 [Teloschistes flavicans]|nr:MAG: hypothetical protein LQ352_006430 [Teloschistes flavicans]